MVEDHRTDPEYVGGIIFSIWPGDAPEFPQEEQEDLAREMDKQATTRTQTHIIYY
ncbi:hypothetical protein EXN66_Car006328 [Channa argus]|uniref:Uncharacterized protein n=1 Tax=Channa argus TaxID=215402 RepID=A0A6G1PK51_CHAAH|nr:hypothetical protein EXN66_Car006328 [Channa argus]